jgi:hypothetical protein
MRVKEGGERIAAFALGFSSADVVDAAGSWRRCRPFVPLTLGLNLEAWRPVPEGRASSFETSMNDILWLSLL